MPDSTKRWPSDKVNRNCEIVVGNRSWQVTYNKAEKQQDLFNQSHRVHITPLDIRPLGGGHTDTHTDICTEVISRNQVRASCGRCAPGLKMDNLMFNDVT